MDTCVHGMLQFIDYFKKGFPHVSTQSFDEGEIDMRTTNDTSDQAGS